MNLTESKQLDAQTWSESTALSRALDAIDNMVVPLLRESALPSASDLTPETVLAELRAVDATRSYQIAVNYWHYSTDATQATPRYFVSIIPGTDGSPCELHESTRLADALSQAVNALKGGTK